MSVTPTLQTTHTAR